MFSSFFKQVLWFLDLFLDIFYSVYPCAAETFKGSNLSVVFLNTLFYPLSFCDEKGE
jgi:hypothetical protein